MNTLQLHLGNFLNQQIGMSTKNYNSFPEAPEVLVDDDGEAHIIRAKQPIEQIWMNEVTPSGLF